MKNLKIKIFFLLVIFLGASFSFAQITATLRQPPPFQFRAADLWRVNLTNTGSPAEIYLKAIVTKGAVNLVEATSSKFTFPTTLTPKLIDAASISPIDLKKKSTEIDEAFKSTGSLPSGN